MKGDDSDIEKRIEERVECVVREKLVNLFTSTREFSHLGFLLETAVKDMQRQFQNEIQDVLGKELKEAKKQLSYIISPKIVDRVNEFESQICSLLNDHAESITKFQKGTLSKFKNEVLPISNLYIITEKINVSKRINAEDYVRSKLKKQGFSVVKQSCDPGVPDFAIYKKIGEEKNLLEMDSYELMARETMSKIPTKEMMQRAVDVEAPIYSKCPVFIEVKSNGDGLRTNQLEWIKNHPDSKVIVYCVEQIIS